MREQRIIQPREGAAYITQYFCGRYFRPEFPIKLMQPSQGKKSIYRVQGAGEIRSKAEQSTMVKWSQPNSGRDGMPIRHALPNYARRLSESMYHPGGNQYERSMH